MSWLAILVALVLAVVAFKVITGVIKFVVIAALLVVAVLFMTGGIAL